MVCGCKHCTAELVICVRQIWMCGGVLEIATCSHVGHVFRKSTPYSFPGGTSKVVNHNNARLAEVWLDDWKHFYYSINPGQVSYLASPTTSLTAASLKGRVF